MSAATGDDPHKVTTASILSRDVPWETYLTARLISEPDLKLIRSYDKRNRTIQADLLAEVTQYCLCSLKGSPGNAALLAF